jgi:type II secretory pathway component PulC
MKTALRVGYALLLALAIAASSIAAEHERCVQVPRERFDAFMSQLRPQPIFRDGQSVGFRIYEFRSQNRLPAIGLQPGDVLTHFCGLPVTEVFFGDKKGDLCCKGKVDTVVYVDIERNGQKMRVKSSIPPRQT